MPNSVVLSSPLWFLSVSQDFTTISVNFSSLGVSIQTFLSPICRYLSDLHAPGDPAWQCIYAQHKWILQLLQNRRDEFIIGQRGDWHIHTRIQTHTSELEYLAYPISGWWMSYVTERYLKGKRKQSPTHTSSLLASLPSLHQRLTPPVPTRGLSVYFFWMYE